MTDNTAKTPLSDLVASALDTMRRGGSMRVMDIPDDRSYSSHTFSGEVSKEIASRADLAAVQPAQVRVKPLVWKQEATNAWVAAHYAIHQYWPHNNGLYSGSGYLGGIGAMGLGKHPTLDAAKAAAQSDYESRILAALEPQPDPRVMGYEQAYQYALTLADALMAKHYPDNKDWQPLGDLTGLLTQIDNMAAGKMPDPRDEVIARLVKAVHNCVGMLDQLVAESGRLVEWGAEDPFRMGEWFEPEDLAQIESARAALAAAKAVQA